MSFTVANLIADLNRKVSPGTTSQSRDIFGAIAEGSRQFLEDIRPKELSRRVLIENALYDQVHQFTCPQDLDEKKIMQWYKLGSHSNSTGVTNTDTWYHPMLQVTNREFDKSKGGQGGNGYYGCGRQQFTIEWQSGVKFIKVTDFQGLSGITLSTMDSLTSNGTWNVFGNVVNLTEDHLTYVAGNGSFRFDINTSSSTGGLETFNITPIDITQYFTIGKIFTWLDLPNANQIQTVTLELLTDASNVNTNLYSITVNSPHDTTAFQVGQNLMGFPFDLDSMNVVGTPNPANIIGMRFRFVTNGTLLMNSVRIDNVVVRKGAVYGIQYISKYIFEQAGTGLWKEAPDDTSDIIHLEQGTYNVLLAYCSTVLGLEIFADTATKTAKGVLLGKLGQLQNMQITAANTYKKNNKTEFIDEQQFVHDSTARFGYYNGRSGWNDNHGGWTGSNGGPNN